MQACQRCGSIGTAQPYRGRGDTRRSPVQLCAECRRAHETWSRYRLRLEMGDRAHVGRADILTEAEAVWGGRATDMVALLLVARDSMDAARRLLAPRSFEQVRPWLEASLQREGDHEGATSRGPQTGEVRAPIGQGATPRREAADSVFPGGLPGDQGASQGRAT